ncbi:MAG: DUF4926 domain-containing protein [Alphaproteobacteria bacterium]|nr:DUF4926 domain-containing protein [Alphaproteobacteria bacterium]
MALNILGRLKYLQRKLLRFAQPTHFAENDVVKAKRELSSRVKAGTIGTVLLVYPGNPTHYEVEFTANSKTLDVITISESDLDLIKYHKVKLWPYK